MLLVKLCFFFILPLQILSQRHSVSEMQQFNFCDQSNLNASPKLKDNIVCTHLYQHGTFISEYPTFCPDKPCACYFEVKGATDQANTDLGNGQYRFSLDKARKICDQYNATLPTIHDRNEFLANTWTFWKDCHNETTLIALGATKVAGKPKVASWDDGVDPDLYHVGETNWENGEASADSFVVVERNGTSQYRAFPTGSITTEQVYVFCKHEWIGNRTESEKPTTVSPNSTVRDYVSKAPVTESSGCEKMKTFSVVLMVMGSFIVTFPAVF